MSEAQRLAQELRSILDLDHEPGEDVDSDALLREAAYRLCDKVEAPHD